MAEAVVDSLPSLKYFCHQCTQEISTVLPDYTCPRCQSGFIEEVTSSSSNSNSDDMSDTLFASDDSDSGPSGYDGNQLSDLLGNIYGQFGSTGAAGSPNHQQPPTANVGRSAQPRTSQTSRNVHVRLPTDAAYDQTIQGIFQHILANMAGGGAQVSMPPGHGASGAGGRRAVRGGGAGAGRGRSGAGYINIDLPIPLFQVLHGNPEDYAWGSGGLDAVITQLLNQLDGAGPPPMPKEEIDGLPNEKIVTEQVEKNLQCTVCMEDYQIDEVVKKMPCGHLFHPDCIVPWLEMHGTCPICRKLLNNGEPMEMGSEEESTANLPSQPTTTNSGSSSSNPSRTTDYQFYEDYD